MLQTLKISNNPNAYYDPEFHMFTREFNSKYIPFELGEFSYRQLEKMSFNGCFDDCKTYEDLINFKLK